MSYKIPRIYPITDTRVSGLTHAEQVERLIAGGARLIQLRDKTATPRQFFADATNALKIARQHDVKIIINDRADIALALRADGLHLGQEDLPPAEARRLLGEQAIIGYSTHSVEQAREAVSMPIDYLAIGPIFPTSSKLRPDPVIGLDNLREVRRIVGDLPLVAIGGVTRITLESVFDAGADSVAVISDILSTPTEIEIRMRDFLSTASAQRG
ncbi:MAG: thiamine phosphate synthase [Pyrinomonadaceae bacterium]